MEKKEFLTLEQVSELLAGMPVKTLRQKIAAGELPAYKPGRRLLVDRNDALRFVMRSKVTA